jgi:hypothetical protein
MKTFKVWMFQALFDGVALLRVENEHFGE